MQFPFTDSLLQGRRIQTGKAVEPEFIFYRKLVIAKKKLSKNGKISKITKIVIALQYFLDLKK